MAGPTTPSDVAILRDLAKRYLDVCGKPSQRTRRDLWARKNSLQPTPPLIYVRAFAWGEMPQSKCLCQNPFYRRHEGFLRNMLFRDTFGDDYVFEPWLTVVATHKCTGWGVSIPRAVSGDPRGSFKVDYPIRAEGDLAKLRRPWHEIDEQQTAADAQRLGDAVGDIITVNVDRRPAYWMWTADISSDIGMLRGIENFMLDTMDRPKWLHKLLAFMRDGILAAQDQAEAAGDWGLCDHQNQAMPYSLELKPPEANACGAKRSELWAFAAAQEMTLISPRMHDEFMLEYQAPILSKFGLVAYGCCEDLTRKIDILRRIPNLRRIAVSPFADTPRCAEQIGTDYVISYRPSPTDMVGYGFDVDRIRSILRRDLSACRGLHVDITLKDVQTVEGDVDRIRKWVGVTRSVVDEFWS